MCLGGGAEGGGEVGRGGGRGFFFLYGNDRINLSNS